MKILHVCNHFHPCTGGIPKYVYDLCIELKKLGHISDVLCLDRCPNSKEKLPQKESFMGITINRVPFFDLKIYKLADLRLLRTVKKYDIIHVHTMGFLSEVIILMKKYHRKPMIFSTHSGIFHTKTLWCFKKIYFDTWCRFIYRMYDKVFADGKDDVKVFSKILKNIDLIPVAINIKKFMSIKRKPEKNRIVYIGRIAKNKRVDNLIKTMFFVKQKIENVKLYIGGIDANNLMPSLRALVNKLDLKQNVVFLGEISEKEVLNQLSKAQLFAFPSEFEGGSCISILETLAAGCPPVVNKLDTYENMVKDNYSGFYVDYEKHKQAAEKIVKLLGCDLTDVSACSRKTSRNFDWSDIIGKIERIYKSLIW